MSRKISPLAQRALGLRCVHNSSSVTKAKRMFVDLGDARSAWARRWSDLIVAHANDLGGAETLSEAQISICRRAAAIEVELESLEGKMSASQPIDIAVYARLVGVLARLRCATRSWTRASSAISGAEKRMPSIRILDVYGGHGR